MKEQNENQKKNEEEEQRSQFEMKWNETHT